MLFSRISRNLEQKLSLGVAIGLAVFAVVAGIATAVFVYRYQLASSRTLEEQLVATIRAQAEVAVFAANEDIAIGVIEGLRANSLIRAVRISSTKNPEFHPAGGPADAFAEPGALDSFVLRSPVDHRSEIGRIEISLDTAEVTRQALASTRLLFAVIALQVVLAVGLIIWLSRRIMIKPITSLAQRMGEIRPGSGIRLTIDGEHESDEIGQLSRSANLLIDAHEKALAELRELATVDALTGAFNRRHFINRMDDELARIQRLESAMAALLMLDIDHFKHVNDTWGHAAGDAALSQLGIMLRSNARKIDTVGRLGGEEFAILLVGTSLAEGMGFAERLRQLIEDTPVNYSGKLIKLTLSIGIDIVSPNDTNTNMALERADRALYIAKQQGRNRVVSGDRCTRQLDRS